MMARRSAEREAFEEAGVLGRIGREPIGSYQQHIGGATGRGEVMAVQAFALRVTDELDVWQEMHLRDRKWFTVKEALRAVRDPEIKDMIRKFRSHLKQSMRTKMPPTLG